MSERRSVFILFIALMLCVSIWKISLQEIHTEYTTYETMETPSNESKANATPMHTTTVSSDLLTKSDAHMLIDLNDFDYIINQAACDEANLYDTVNEIDKPPIALILVHSAPQNWHKRNVIRQTWGGSDSRAARILFLLGAVNSSTMQVQLNEENSQFQDIIQGNFVDAYRNMTYKHTMAFKWFIYNCPKLKYLVKTDDDVFINTPAVFEYLDAAGDNGGLLMCVYRIEDARVKRTYRSKWRVSHKEFADVYYPPYCPGFSIVYSADVVGQLYREAQQAPYFWIDDVHMTGTLAKHAKVNITSAGKYFMNELSLNGLIDGRIQLADVQPTFLFTEPNLPEEKIRFLWDLVSR